jgi:ABC-type transport system involved in multi-copper enzyme maturation permease subunit
MFRNIYVKEMQYSLRTIRFVIALLVTLVAFSISGIVGSATYHNLQQEYRQRSREELDKLLSLKEQGLHRVAFHNQAAMLPPPEYPFIRDLSDTRLPDMVPVNVVSHKEMERSRRGNSYLFASETFTWLFIAATISAFLAILLSYDAVAEERRSGTLALICANSLGRWRLLTAKIAALVTINTVLLIFGALVSLLVLALGNVPVLRADSLITCGLFILLSVLFLTLVTTLGVGISCLTRFPSISLTVLIAVWVVFALVLPSAARIVSASSHTVPTPLEKTRESDDVVSQIISEGDKTRPLVNGSSLVNYDRFPFGPVERHVADYSLRVHEAQRRLEEKFERNLFTQAEGGLELARWSPVEIFAEAAAHLTDSGIDRMKRFLAAVEQYRNDLGEFTRSLDSGDKNSPHVYFADLFTLDWISQRPVDASVHVPTFSMPEAGLDVRVSGALFPAALLLAITLVLYILTVILFSRIDVRYQQS